MMNKRILQDGFRNPYLEALQGLNVRRELAPDGDGAARDKLNCPTASGSKWSRGAAPPTG